MEVKSILNSFTRRKERNSRRKAKKTEMVMDESNRIGPKSECRRNIK
jgi:hypothetical protein